MKAPRNYYPVGYTFDEAGRIVTWATVITGKDEASALAAFRQKNQHVLSVWIIVKEDVGE
ncbi:MAG: hypothetical protein HOP33_09130 [Verrucomicrobia bacterium]|nr:hypothetical protein [Verrucomicrobiota bacterium]